MLTLMLQVFANISLSFCVFLQSLPASGLLTLA